MKTEPEDNCNVDDPHQGNEAPTLEALGAKLKAVAAENKGKLDLIDQKKDEEVVCGFNYNLDTNLPSSSWELAAIPGKAKVSERLQEWTYRGPPLKQADDVFNDNIDYQFSEYEGVVRLNDTLLKVGSKYCDLLADKPKTRITVSVFVKNLETLSATIEELVKLTVDAKDNLSESATFKETMKALSSNAEHLKSELGSSVFIKVTYHNDNRSASAKRQRTSSGYYCYY